MMIIFTPVAIAAGIGIIHARINYLMDTFGGQSTLLNSREQPNSM